MMSTLELVQQNWKLLGILFVFITYESTPLNKLAVADAAWARMPVDSLNMTLA